MVIVEDDAMPLATAGAALPDNPALNSAAFGCRGLK